MKIFQPTTEDLNEINQLLVRTKQYYNYTKSIAMIWSSTATVTEETLEERLFWVGKVSDELVFVYSIQRAQDDDYRLTDCWVSPSHMGKGYGRAMFDHIKVFLQSIGANQLLITATNDMVPFYKKMNAIRFGHTMLDELDAPIHHFKIVV